MRGLTLSVLPAIAVACGPGLPDPASPGARVLETHCTACHRIYVPQLMTFEMWKVQLDRKERLFARQGRPWLSDEEERVLLAYLETYAGGL